MRPSRRECKREEVLLFSVHCTHKRHGYLSFNCPPCPLCFQHFPFICISPLPFHGSSFSFSTSHLLFLVLFSLSLALSLPRSPSSSIWPQVSPHASNGQRSKSRVYKVSKRNSPRGDSKPAQTHTWNPCEPQNTDKKILNTLR